MTNEPSQHRHFLTVDLEEYFQVLAFASIVSVDDWERYPPRAEAATDRLLETFAHHGVRATFFTVGWLAERAPQLIRRIVDAGHEIASHSWWHRHLATLSPALVQEDVRRSRDTLEQVAGTRVYGFRAPSFSISPGREWVFDILLEEGYRYDSSIFPIRRPDYGYPGAPRQPYLIDRPGGTLLELPLATATIAGVRLPAAGGGYLRHFPLGLIRKALRDSERAGQPGMFYIHPWEIDPDQPRLPVSMVTRWRHYAGLDKTLGRLTRLLEEFTFTSIADFYHIGTDPQLEDEWWPARSA